MSRLFPLLGYLLGSISSAVLVTRAFGLQDPREVGSRNPGATNVLRYGGKSAAVLTLLGDATKGAIPVVIARAFGVDPGVIAATALAAFVGHCYPVFFGFKGGKGVATAAGVWLAASPMVGLALIGTWIGMAAVFRYSSLSALTAAVAAPCLVAWLDPNRALLLASIAMSALLLWRHRSNIRNLMAGREGKISAS